MESACVVDLINEVRKIGNDVCERFVVPEIDGLDLANPRAIYRPQQKRQRMVRMRPLLLPAFLAFTAAVLPPNASIGQDAGFGRDADVHVREDSFACKETSELDRLLQRNQSGGFTSGVQLYEYLQSHNCIGLSAGRVRVYATHGQYVCIYDPKGKNKPIKPCAWTRKDMLSK